MGISGGGREGSEQSDSPEAEEIVVSHVSDRELLLKIGSEQYQVLLQPKPFSEGMRLSCDIDGEEISIEDQGLGAESSAKKLAERILRYERDHS